MKTLPFKRILTGLILAALLFLTFYIRIQGVERIPDRQFTGNDAYLYYKQAETIAEQGSLPGRDMDRWLPLAMLAWFIIWVSLSRGAKRSDLFIGIPLAYGTAWLLYLSPTHLIQWLKDTKIVYPHLQEKRATTLFAILVLIPILFWTPVGGHATRSIYYAARLKKPTPGEGSETKALQWMKDTLPEKQCRRRKLEGWQQN